MEITNYDSDIQEFQEHQIDTKVVKNVQFINNLRCNNTTMNSTNM